MAMDIQRSEAQGGGCIELVERAIAGDRDAVRGLYDAFGKKIHNFALGMLRSGSEAEDVTQEAFVLAFRNIGALKSPGRFEQWLFRIARNEIYQRFRKRNATEWVDLEADITHRVEPTFRADLKDDPEKAVLQRELKKVIADALAGLPEKFREVFILSVIHSVSYKEIAEIVGRSVLAVKTDIYRARLMAKDSIRRYLRRE